jgi:outer membrane protein assembly factor BamB
VIHDNMLISQADVQEDSFLAALDIEAGKELWRTPRNDVPRTAGTAWHNAHGKDYIDETNRSRIEQI